MTPKTVLLMANLDTRGAEFLVYKDLVRELGLQPLLLDFSMEEVPPPGADITVQRGGGRRRPGHRDGAGQIPGGAEDVHRLHDQGCPRHRRAAVRRGAHPRGLRRRRRHVDPGVHVGHAGLPFGFPKLMATSIASYGRYVESCVGTRDITMLHTVVDVMGSNALLDQQLRNGIAAVCGMAGLYEHAGAARAGSRGGHHVVRYGRALCGTRPCAAARAGVRECAVPRPRSG